MFWGLNTTRNNAAGQIAISRRRDQIVVFSHLLRVASLVGVVLDGRLAVRLLDLVGIRVLGHAEEVVKLLGVALMSGKGVFEPWSAAEVDGRRRGGRRAKKEDPGRNGRRQWRGGAPSGARACRRNASGRLFFGGFKRDP